MNATTRTPRRTLRLLAVVAALLVVSLVKPAPASAYQVIKSGNYPGRVTGYVVQGTHFDSCPTTYYSCFTPWVVGSGPTVYRSPASSGTQKIDVIYQLQRHNGSVWVNQAQAQHTRYLGSGYSWINMPRVDFLPNAAGYFRVQIYVAWGNRYDTVNFGTKGLLYTQSGDYQCNTRFPCQAGAGWVWLRSPGV